MVDGKLHVTTSLLPLSVTLTLFEVFKLASVEKRRIQSALSGAC